MKTLIFTVLVVFSIELSAQSNTNNGMVLISAGEFIMGKDIKNGLGFSPAHKVKVNSFYMDTCEVTNREYLVKVHINSPLKSH